MDIEAWAETVALLFNNGLVHNYADLYELTVRTNSSFGMAQKIMKIW
jgi:NAD-dependent DNA ligase